MELFAIYGAVEAEVEAVEGALFAEVGTLGAAFDHTLVAYIEFVLQEQFQELDVVEFVAAGFAAFMLPRSVICLIKSSC